MGGACRRGEAKLESIFPEALGGKAADGGDDFGDEIRGGDVEPGIDGRASRVGDADIGEFPSPTPQSAGGAQDFVLVAFFNGDLVAGGEVPVQGAEGDGDVERDAVAVGENGAGVGADFVGDFAGAAEGTVAANNDKIDQATAHEIARGVVGDDMVGDALLGEFPSGERGALGSGPGLGAVHMERFAEGVGGVDGGGGGAMVHKGKPTGVAMGEDSGLGRNQIDSDSADGLAMLGILVRESLGGEQGAALFGFQIPLLLDFPEDPAHGIDGINGGWAGLGESLKDVQRLALEGLGSAGLGGAQALGEAVGGGGGDGSGATNSHVANGLGGLAKVGGFEDLETVWKETLVDEVDGVGGGVESDGAEVAAAAPVEDAHVNPPWRRP